MHERVCDRNCGQQNPHAIVLCSSLFLCGGSHPDFVPTSARLFHRAARESERDGSAKPKTSFGTPSLHPFGERPSIAKRSLALLRCTAILLSIRLQAGHTVHCTVAQSRTRPHVDNRCFPSFGEQEKPIQKIKSKSKTNTKTRRNPNLSAMIAFLASALQSSGEAASRLRTTGDCWIARARLPSLFCSLARSPPPLPPCLCCVPMPSRAARQPRKQAWRGAEVESLALWPSLPHIHSL